VVGAAILRPHAEDEDAGGLAVEAVDRRERRDAQRLAQPHQRGLAQVAAGGDRGQEVGLVDDDQVLVAVQQLQLERHARLGRRVAPVPQQVAGGAARAGGQRASPGIEHVAAREPRWPVGDRGKAGGEEREDVREAAVADADAAGGDAVAQRRHERRGRAWRRLGGHATHFRSQRRCRPSWLRATGAAGAAPGELAWLSPA